MAYKLRLPVRVAPPASKPLPPAQPLPPLGRYRARADRLFPGTWRVQPAKYDGRGFVYLFSGEHAAKEARAFARTKNNLLKEGDRETK